MRHLLEVLRKDFEEPINMSTSSAELDKMENDLLDTLIPLESRGKQLKTKEDNDLLPYASLIKYCDIPEHTDLLSGFTTLCSSERTASPAKTNKMDEEGDNQEKLIGSPQLNEHIANNAGTTEEDFRQNQISTTAVGKEITNESHEYTTVTNDEEFHQDQAEVSYDGQSKELEDLGRSFSESLHVSNNTDSNITEPANEQHTDVAASVSDDEFWVLLY